jgi:KEOPS complex subunit Cgi121
MRVASVYYSGVSGRYNRKKSDAVAKARGIEIIALDARMVFGAEHMETAIEHAAKAFKSGRNVAKSPGIEIVRYASGERQISKALLKMCARPGSRKIVLLVTGACNPSEVLRELSLKNDENALVPDPDNLSAFGITDAERASVHPKKQVELVLERVALLDLIK